MTARPKLQLAKSTYREARRPDGTLGFTAGRGRGISLGAGWGDDARPGVQPLFVPAQPTLFVPAPQPGGGGGGRGRGSHDDDSDEEILMIKPPAAVGAPRSKAVPPLPADTVAIPASKPRLTLRLSEPPPPEPKKSFHPAPAASAWTSTTWQTPSPKNAASPPGDGPAGLSLGVPPPGASGTSAWSTPTAASNSGARSLPPPVTAAEASHFMGLLSRASGGSGGDGGGPGASQAAPVDAPARPSGALPVDAHRAEIVAAVAGHSVVVIRGETGCGKSSRVPEFLAEADPAARVVVAQPRRLAAIALARRVAASRGEAVGQGLVGYRVGQAAKCGPRTRLTFVTTGWLLTKLVHHAAASEASGPSSGGKGRGGGGGFEYTHVVLDEVHERDLETDLLCLVCRLLLKRYGNAVVDGTVATGSDGPPFKLVCMSATFDANEFVRYFRPACSRHGALVGSLGAVAPPLVVGARRFRVAEVYLDDMLGGNAAQAAQQAVAGAPKAPEAAALLAVGASLPPDERRAVLRHLGSHHFRPFLLRARAKQGLLGTGLPGEEEGWLPASPASHDEAAAAAAAAPGGGGGGGGSDPKEAAAVALPDAMLRLAARLVYAVARERPGDGILVFLSGVAEMDGVVEHLRDLAKAEVAKGGLGQLRGGASGLPLGLRVSVLHSLVDLADQASTFDAVNAGCAEGSRAVTHVVLATNLAESSLTLPRLRTVIDLGVHKEVASATPRGPLRGSGDGVASLRRVWVSRASARQRSGRAGRVAEGVVYRLYPRAFFDEGMEDWDQPEMARLPLEQVVLKAKLLGVPSVHATLADCLVPPARASVDAAVRTLLGLGGFCRKEVAAAAPRPYATMAGAAAGVQQVQQAQQAQQAEAGFVRPSALDDGCDVTAIGRALASLPLDLHLSRLVLLAAPLGVAPEALVMACVFAGGQVGDVFAPLPSAGGAGGGSGNDGGGGSDGDAAAATAFALAARARWDRGLYSEPLAALEAFKHWLLFRHAALSPSVAAEKSWCAARGLSRRRLLELGLRCRELASRLAEHLPTAAPVLLALFASGGEATTFTACDGPGDGVSDRARLLEGLGRDVGTLRHLLLALAVSAAPACLLAATPRLRPPKAIARHHHGGSATASLPAGARLAVLSGVAFRPAAAFSTPASAAGALQAALASALGEGALARLEFVPPDGGCSGGARLVGPALLAAGSWVATFHLDARSPADTPEWPRTPEDSAAAEAAAETAAEGFSAVSPLRDLHRHDLPAALKTLALLSRARGGLRLPLDGGVGGGVVAVGSVRWSFSTAFQLCGGGGLAVVPSRLSALSFAAHANFFSSSGATGGGGFAVCAGLAHGGGGGGDGSVAHASGTTLLPHDTAALAAALLLLAPSGTVVGLGGGAPAAGPSSGAYSGGWIRPGGSGGGGVPLLRWGGVLSAADVDAANAFRRRLSAALTAPAACQGGADPGLARLLKDMVRRLAVSLAAGPGRLGAAKRGGATGSGAAGAGAAAAANAAANTGRQPNRDAQNCDVLLVAADATPAGRGVDGGPARGRACVPEWTLCGSAALAAGYSTEHVREEEIAAAGGGGGDDDDGATRGVVSADEIERVEVGEGCIEEEQAKQESGFQQEGGCWEDEEGSWDNPGGPSSGGGPAAHSAEADLMRSLGLLPSLPPPSAPPSSAKARSKAEADLMATLGLLGPTPRAESPPRAEPPPRVDEAASAALRSMLFDGGGGGTDDGSARRSTPPAASAPLAAGSAGSLAMLFGSAGPSSSDLAELEGGGMLSLEDLEGTSLGSPGAPVAPPPSEARPWSSAFFG